jgi:hypothetical protein
LVRPIPGNGIPGRLLLAISVEQVTAAAERLLAPLFDRRPEKRGRSSFPTSEKKSEKSCVPF